MREHVLDKQPGPFLFAAHTHDEPGELGSQIVRDESGIFARWNMRSDLACGQLNLYWLSSACAPLTTPLL